jgi:hypothetical protein
MFIAGLVLLLLFAIGLRRAPGDERPTNPDIGPNTVELLSYYRALHTELKFWLRPGCGGAPRTGIKLSWRCNGL